MLRVIIIIFLSLACARSNASIVDNIITISQVSSSGKTLIINKGRNDQIQFDDYGILLMKVQEKGKVIYRPVAKIKAVKVFGETSLWVTFRVFESQMIKAKKKFLLFSETSLLKGRTDLKLTRSKIIGKKTKIKKQVIDSFKEETDGLSKKEKNYTVQQRLHERQKHYESDVELVDLDSWEDQNNDGNMYPIALYRSPYAKEFSEKKRLQTFEKMVVAHLRKYNDPNFSLKNLYYKQRKNKYIQELPEDSQFANYFEQFKDNREKILEKEDKIYSDLKNKGESWSDDYSDEELSELIYNIGAIKERERRAVIAAHKFDHQFYGNFGLNLINNENLNDKKNTEQSKYDLELGWEYYFLKDINYLNRFAFELSGRRAQDAFNIGGGYNATSTEYSLAIQVNWYPFLRPNVLEGNILYFGLLLRTGLSRLKLSETAEEGNYQTLSLPGLRMGIKYNFSNSFGLRLLAAFENIGVSRLIKNDDTGLLPDRENYIEGKLSLGISKFY